MLKLTKNILENLKITQLDKNYKLLNTIVSDRAIIEKKNGFLKMLGSTLRIKKLKVIITIHIILHSMKKLYPTFILI